MLTLQDAAKAQWGKPAPRVKGRVRKMQGGFSGGTAASLKATLAAAAREPSLLKLLASPFALTPGFSGPHQPTGLIPEYDATLGAWLAPFVMAPINTKNVHRTNFLLGHAWGEDFRYDEMMVAPGVGDMARAAAEAIAKINPFAGDKGPKPGEGPSKEERDNGFYDLLFVGLDGDRRIDCVVTGDRDPGYGSTSKMIAETALALVEDDPEPRGGVWTPGALLGTKLRDRLQKKAGLTFTAG